MSNNKLLTQWVNQYTNDLFSWANYKTSNKEIAEDLVQETFLAAAKSINSLKNVNQAKTWLFAILNKKIIDYYRKKGSNKIFNQSEVESINQTNSLFDDKGNWNDTSINPLWESENLLDNNDFNTILKKCIENLPTTWSMAISAKYTLDKKASEICKELNISSSNYWQIIHRAKLQLKICIEKNWTN